MPVQKRESVISQNSSLNDPVNQLNPIITNDLLNAPKSYEVHGCTDYDKKLEDLQKDVQDEVGAYHSGYREEYITETVHNPDGTISQTIKMRRFEPDIVGGKPLNNSENDNTAVLTDIAGHIPEPPVPMPASERESHTTTQQNYSTITDQSYKPPSTRKQQENTKTYHAYPPSSQRTGVIDESQPEVTKTSGFPTATLPENNATHNSQVTQEPRILSDKPAPHRTRLSNVGIPGCGTAPGLRYPTKTDNQQMRRGSFEPAPSRSHGGKTYQMSHNGEMPVECEGKNMMGPKTTRVGIPGCGPVPGREEQTTIAGEQLSRSRLPEAKMNPTNVPMGAQSTAVPVFGPETGNIPGAGVPKDDSNHVAGAWRNPEDTQKDYEHLEIMEKHLLDREGYHGQIKASVKPAASSSNNTRRQHSADYGIQGSTNQMQQQPQQEMYQFDEYVIPRSELDNNLETPLINDSQLPPNTTIEKISMKIRGGGGQPPQDIYE